MFKSVLLTNLDWSRLLHIGHVCRRVFTERGKVDIYNNAKRTRPISAADPGKGPGRTAPPHPAPLMFRAKWGPNGRQICFWNPTPPPSLIWRSGSATAYPSTLTEQAWSINDLLHGQKEKVLGERPVGKDKSNQNTGFALPCPLAESAIYN